MTISVPDDLYEEVKAAEFNASAVSQEAFRDELTRRGRLAELDAGMERVELYIDGKGHVAFTGRVLATTDGISGLGTNSIAYLTSRHRIAIYNEDSQALDEYDSFDHLVSQQGWDAAGQEFRAAIADALDRKHVIELDI